MKNIKWIVVGIIALALAFVVWNMFSCNGVYPCTSATVYGCNAIDGVEVSNNLLTFDGTACPITETVVSNNANFNMQANGAYYSQEGILYRLKLNESCQNLERQLNGRQSLSSQHEGLYRDQQKQVFWCVGSGSI